MQRPYTSVPVTHEGAELARSLSGKQHKLLYALTGELIEAGARALGLIPKHAKRTATKESA